MSIVKKVITATIISIAILLVNEAIAGGRYLFTVTCPSSPAFVAEWDTGTIDPGKEYLRAQTGTKNPNCSIRDYNAGTDKRLPRRRFSHTSGVIEGIPLVGPVIHAVGNAVGKLFKRLF